MAFAGAMRLGLHHGAWRTMNPALRSSNTRLFSSLLTNYRAQAAVVLPRTRHISSTPTPPPSGPVDVPPIPDGFVVTPETAEAATSVVDTVTNAVIPALQYGDFAALGLASWVTPAGWIRWSMELINVSTGMSWFWTIVIGTALWRAACVPFAVIGLRESAKAQPHQENVKHINDNLMAAVRSGDKVAAQKMQIVQKQYNAEHGLNPLRGAVAALQLPIQLGLFFGVQKMSEQVVQLHQSGVSWLPDLTAADPTYVLPVVFAAVVQIQIMLAAPDINTVTNPGMGHMMNGFRILSALGAWFMSGWPSGLFVSLLTTSTLTTIQSAVLRAPTVRRALNIPITPPESRGKLPSMKETYEFVVNKYRQRIDDAKAAQMAQMRGPGGMPRRRVNEISYELPKKVPKTQQKKRN
ncbi:hypothetical protein D9619_009106 [Psilocybe cf. subviscida]|uniref:Membrane insertase YidC/Oxa/ALB C-terminal domain-containing protein n=1 Tax=Psilocybe cf. subviscida TaxID=2480587 RepID=A0A8H5BU66_9AGAR|nr:hypothetical protein D9619_009106 [Psilocybe cf. subviscida]